MRDQKRALKIQALMGFKPMDFKTKYCPAYEIKKKSGFDGIQTHDKIFYTFQNVREESL